KERPDRDDRTERFDPTTPPRPASEGVRIIGAEEAQAALDTGQAAGRVPDDAPKYGDVPQAPPGPRPPLRFPLGGGDDPASVAPKPPPVTAPRFGTSGNPPPEPPAAEPPVSTPPPVTPEPVEEPSRPTPTWMPPISSTPSTPSTSTTPPAPPSASPP